jgi:GNAT superfamily N-acetyltransferase
MKAYHYLLLLLLAGAIAMPIYAQTDPLNPSGDGGASADGGSIPTDPTPSGGTSPATGEATSTPTPAPTVAPTKTTPKSSPISSPGAVAPNILEVQEPAEASLPPTVESSPEEYPQNFPLVILAGILALSLIIGLVIKGKLKKQSDDPCEKIKKNLEAKKSELKKTGSSISLKEAVLQNLEREIEEKGKELKKEAFNNVKEGAKEVLSIKEASLIGKTASTAEKAFEIYEDLKEKYEEGKKLLEILKAKKGELEGEVGAIESSYKTCVLGADAKDNLAGVKNIILPDIDNLKIQKYSPRYQKQVKSLVGRVHSEYGFAYDSSLDHDLEDPEKFYNANDGAFYVLLDGEKVVGTAAVQKYDPDIAELKRMYLEKEYRRKGWGTKLLHRATNFAKENKFKKIVLDTDIRQPEAINFYTKMGFVTDKKEKDKIFMSLDVMSFVESVV